MKIRNFRHIIQACFAALSNGYISGFVHGKIYTGNTKYLCNPGMNCYSCPGALTSCPIGSLQAVLNSRNYKYSLYAVGFIFIFGSLLGRLTCVFLCPFGFIQDLIYKISFIKKIRSLPAEKFLRKIKYIFLFLMVILLPLTITDKTGLGLPFFCKYICPVGTLEGGIPLILLNKTLQSAALFLFKWKFAILIAILMSSVIVYRPFCRYFCPLGAIYGFFIRFSIYRYKIDKTSCTNCGTCQKKCKFNIEIYKTPNSADCIRCGECIKACPKNCIKIKGLKEN